MIMKFRFLYQQKKFTFHFSLSVNRSHTHFLCISFDSFDFEGILASSLSHYGPLCLQQTVFIFCPYRDVEISKGKFFVPFY